MIFQVKYNLQCWCTPAGLYFSAHWCPPCRAFTPELAKFYKKMTDKLEIVFVSSDEDEAQWAEYFAEMPWLALPFVDRDRKVSLQEYDGNSDCFQLIVFYLIIMFFPFSAYLYYFLVHTTLYVCCSLILRDV